MPDLSFTDTSNVATNDISWTSVQRTSTTSTLTYRLWNNLAAATPPRSTAASIFIYPLYRYGGAGNFTTGGEAGVNQWLQIRLNGNVQNPTGNTGADYQAVTTGWYGIGGDARFFVPAPIPDQMARELEIYLSPEGQGAATSIEMKLVIDYGRGIYTIGPYAEQRHGNASVFQGQANRYALIRGREDIGFRITQDLTATLDSVLIETGTFQTGAGGLGKNQIMRFVIPAVETDGDGNPLTVGLPDYKILVSRNPSADVSVYGSHDVDSAFTFTKGSRGTTGAAIPPAPPSSNHVTLAIITKTTDSSITNSEIDSYALHEEGTITYDGTGADVDIGPLMSTQSGALQLVEEQRNSGTLTNSSTNYVRHTGQNVLQIDTTQPGDNERFLGRVSTGVGTVSAYSNRQVYDARSSYRARRKELVGPWLTPNNSDQLFVFGRMDKLVSGAIDQTPTTQTMTFVGGHRISVLPDMAASGEGVLEFRGSPITDGTENTEANGSGQIQVVDNAGLGAGEAITMSLNGSTTAYTQGVEWAVGGGAAATAANIAAAIDGDALGGSTMAATDDGVDTVTVWAETAGDTIGATHDAVDNLLITCSEVHLVTKDNYWIHTENRWMGTAAADQENSPDVVLSALNSHSYYTVVAFAGLAGDTATLTVNGTATVLTEGVHWTAAVDNATTANTLADAINTNVAGVTAWNSGGATVYIHTDLISYDLSIATSDAVNLTATDDELDLDASTQIYRSDLWNNEFRPCHIARLKVEFVPTSDLCQLRARVMVVRNTGSVVTLLDSGTKSGFAGTTGVGTQYIPMRFELSKYGSTDCDQEDIALVPDQCVLDPWRGDGGLYVILSSLVDVDSARCTLYYYNNFE